jgi:putative membrane protein
MRTIIQSLAIFASLITLSSRAGAQGGNPAGITPGTRMARPGVPAPYQVNNPDRLFVHLLASGGNAEIADARLAESRARSARVKEFARTMLRDHDEANERLADLADKARVPVPKGTDREHRAKHAWLEGLSGSQFDLAYMRAQIVDHQKAVQLLQWEISAAQDDQLRRYASDTLPKVFHHLQMAQTLVAELTRSTPQGLAATAIRPRRAATMIPGAGVGR